MAGYRARRTTAGALTAAVAIVAAALAGCSGDDSPSDAVSKAASAARSAGAEVTAAASSLASRAAEAYASATAEAGRTFDDIKGGVDAKGSVTLGSPDTDSDGRTTVEVTAENTADSAKSFAVQVDFTDRNGKLLDVVVVTISDVPAGGSGKASARSNRELSEEAQDEVKTKVGRAVRY
ncbi:FxLYD domain-containing protein [Streptomyces sp. NBC_00289]|uniref:FxLYD domain-containing protein n=1 Tax=Streptomyces sp. NBC_00289 TaxID=2975703 RepID=UPI0032461F59